MACLNVIGHVNYVRRMVSKRKITFPDNGDVWGVKRKSILRGSQIFYQELMVVPGK
jgi:hypothetical protein